MPLRALFERRLADPANSQLVGNLQSVVEAHLDYPYSPPQSERLRARQNTTMAAIAHVGRGGAKRRVDRSASTVLGMHDVKVGDMSAHLDISNEPSAVDIGAGKSPLLREIAGNTRNTCWRTAVERDDEYAQWQLGQGNKVEPSLSQVPACSADIVFDTFGALFWPDGDGDASATPAGLKRIMKIGGFAFIIGVADPIYLRECEHSLERVTSKKELQPPVGPAGYSNLFTARLRIASVGMLALDTDFKIVAARMKPSHGNPIVSPDYRVPNALWLRRVR